MKKPEEMTVAEYNNLLMERIEALWDKTQKVVDAAKEARDYAANLYSSVFDDAIDIATKKANETHITMCAECKNFIEESEETGRGRCAAWDYGGKEKKWHGTISATNCPKAEAKGAENEASEF